MTEQEYLEQAEPIHNWFELSYAQYLTVPRSIMEAMPKEWQAKMAAMLDELDETFDWRPDHGRYWVQLKSAKGKIVHDELMEYRRPNREFIESIRKVK